MKKTNLVDHGFMDARIKLIDVAAFLDRIQRHEQTDDYRFHALKDAINELQTDEVGRVGRILSKLSDHSVEPIDKADIQGAFGAPKPNNQ
ncbi:MAG: hypothetical protein ACPGNW_06220 [Verrucomicrobiales bacterium]|nr:hypothetical protein [Verrucomicrobiota bacterium]MEC7638771.1 hypothetical protein [Verrucomicrobiota bacterium]MEC8659524.1 hypothetical protein [Verrucomicrobiota bacterium]